MSYPPLPGYYASSNQSSSGNGAYNSNRNTEGRSYPSQMTTPSNAQNVSYGSSAYDWSGQSSYPSSNTPEAGSGSWRQDAQDTNQGYQRGSTYGNQDAASTDSYSQTYYETSSTNQTRLQNHAQGLNSLAYASGLDAANSRSNSAQTTQQYGSTSYSPTASQSRVRSPIETQARYSVNLPPSSTSHHMQAQNSSSSASTQQLAVNAAAALAGAVSRHYSLNGTPVTNATNSSSVGQNSRSDMSATPRRTASPQLNATDTSQPYSGDQPQSSHNQYAFSLDTTRQGQTASATGQSSRPAQDSTVAQRIPQRQTSVTPKRAQQPTINIASLVTVPQESESTQHHHNTEAFEPVPTFIDPARVFNPYHREHERKRQQAEAEAKRKAGEDVRAEELRKQKEKEAEEAAQRQREMAEQGTKQLQAAAQAAKKSSKSVGTNNATEAASSANTMPNASEGEEAAMAAEMQAMVEKMKAFRSRDPSLFQKLWEDMRKPGSSGAGTSIQSPPPQLAQQSLSVSQAMSQPNAASERRPAGESAQKSTPGPASQRSPDTIGVPANGWRVVVNENPEGLPDLGRFPAERRIRSSGCNKRTKLAGADKVEITGDATTRSTSPHASAPSTSSTPVPSAERATGSSIPAALSGVLPPSAAKTATSPESTQDGSNQNLGTVWPVEKRNAITRTAIRVLKASPENANVELTESDLHKMLAKNPSYITLCETLEQKGLHFHRGQFARELLNSVPELKSAAQDSSAAKPVQASTTPLRRPPPPPLPAPTQSTYSAPPLYPQGPVQPRPSRAAYPPPQGQPPGRYRPLPQMQQAQPITFVGSRPDAMNAATSTPIYRASKQQYGQPSRPQRTPGSKEAAARKRDFSELIDLTELGENDDYVMPNKHVKPDDTDSDVEMEMNPFQAYQAQPQTSAPYRFNPLAPGHSTPQPPPAFDPHANTMRSHKPELPAETSSQRMILAKPLNKNEALKKIYYDPKTVARDILIATGRHPSERPLNVHLAGMLGKYIELESDVSTFEWDEIDPGGPPAPKVDLVNLPASKPRYKIGERVPSRARRPGPKTLIDKPRRPDQEKRQKPAVGTVGASVPDKLTHDPSHLRVAKQQPSKLRHSLLASEQAGLATPSSHDPTLPAHDKSRRSASRAVEIQPPAEKASTPSRTMETPQLKKRGRPPGAKNKFPTVAGLKEQAIRVNIPPRDTTPTKDKFRCKWRKCNTSLHNLDTLRKHVGRVHRPTSDQTAKEGYTCWWKKCKFLAQDDEGAWITTQAFDHWEDWLKHIEKDHITPIAMKWGDGPATQHVDPLEIQQDRQRYLATVDRTASGVECLHETTPMVNAEHNEYHPPDVLNLTRVYPSGGKGEKEKADEAAFKAFMHSHEIGKDSRQASKEVIRAMAKRKERIGAGIDRGGCTLITEEMRETFVQNPGIRNIIPRHGS